jgi:hypothetical protein
MQHKFHARSMQYNTCNHSAHCGSFGLDLRCACTCVCVCTLIYAEVPLTHIQVLLQRDDLRTQVGDTQGHVSRAPCTQMEATQGHVSRAAYTQAQLASVPETSYASDSFGYVCVCLTVIYSLTRNCPLYCCGRKASCWTTRRVFTSSQVRSFEKTSVMLMPPRM